MSFMSCSVPTSWAPCSDSKNTDNHWSTIAFFMMLCCPCNRIVRLSARHACAWLAVARSADISDDEVLCELLALNGGGR